MPSDELFTREEALGGLPAKRAATLLFLIESRTAHLADQSRRAMEVFLTEEVAKERDLAFLEAFSLGREPPLRPTIQDLERFAPQWAPLVPDNPQVQAAVAHLLSQKYSFTYPAVPAIRATLGLDEDAVQRSYYRLYRESLEKIFAPRPSLVERLRWVWAAVRGWPDFLPPFWTAFVLTVALPLPAAFLALPIAVARVGPLSGLVFVVVIGVLNVLTMACMAEACGRSGPMRYGRTFLGRLVADFLGSAGSSLLSLALGARNFLTLLSSSFGMAITLVAFTGVPAIVWIALLLLAEVYLLSRKTLKLTVTAMVLLAAMNIALILPIVLLTFSHARSEYLLHMQVPLLQGEPFDPQVLRLVFGVILSLYFGHIYVVHSAKVVLPRDPSARSLIQGSVAGTASLIGLLAVWVLAVGGAVPAQALAGQAGTVLTPLAERVGPSIHVLGSGLIIFFLGMSCIRTANVVFNLVHERLPSRVRTMVTLPRRRGSLLLQLRRARRGSLRLGLTYLGQTEGHPRFRLVAQWDGHLHQAEMTLPQQWEARTFLDGLPEPPPRGTSLALEILEASPELVRLRVSTTMILSYEGEWDTTGLDMADILTLPDPIRQFIAWMTRRGEVSLAEATAHTGRDEVTTRAILDALVRQELVYAVERHDGPRYRIRFAARRGRQASQKIWQVLDTRVDEPAGIGRSSRPTGVTILAQRIREALLGGGGRFFLSLCPVLVALLLAWWLLATGAGSFTWLISFTGVITLTLASGIFPVLLMVASRRKGDLVPGVVYGFLSHPVLVTTIYVFFLANLFLHGFVIWDNPLARTSAVVVGLVVIGVTIAMVRAGAFAPRIVVELREDQREGGRGAFAVTAGGQPASAEVRLGYPEGDERYETASGQVPTLSALRFASFYLPKTAARELKVWVHRVTPEGGSEGLPAVAEVHCGSETRRLDLKLSGGEAVVPVGTDACWLRITLAETPSCGSHNKI